MIKNAATTKAASNTSPGLLLLFYITIGTLPQIIRKLPLLGRESLLFDNEIKAFLWLDIGGAFYNIMLDSGAKARRYHARSNA
jgi:hypothetical protein